MSADVLELQPKIDFDSSHEVYAHSLSTLRKLGALATEPMIDIEYKAAVEDLAFDDFATAVAEMLKTDKEFGETMEVNNVRIHAVIDGEVRARDGSSMVDILRNGADQSAHLANHDPRYKHQAERDAWDVVTAQQVDQLQPGQTLWGVSFAARQALEDYPEVYDKEFGYKKNLVYVQTYSMQDGMLTAGSYSFEVDEDITEFREALAARGMEIPENESDNSWLRHSQVVEASAEQAQRLVDSLRKEYYRSISKHANQESVSDYVEANGETLRQIFEAYYFELGAAVHTGKNRDILKSFANSIQQSGASLKPEIRQRLFRIVNSENFSDQDGSLMDSLIRYAAAEQMRKGLVAKSKEYGTPQVTTNSGQIDKSASINDLLSQNIKVGIEAQRSYGGCPGNIELGAKGAKLGGELKDALESELSKLQEAFGGKEGKETWEWKTGVCRIKSCKTRPGKTEVGPCNICRTCQDKFDKGEDPTKISKEADSTELHEKVLLFEKKQQDEQRTPEPELARAA